MSLPPVGWLDETELCSARDGCWFRPGDVDCPLSHPHKQLFFAGADDTRDCSACGCETTGQAHCTMDLEICSVAVYPVTVASDAGAFCHNSSDGDGTTILDRSLVGSVGCDVTGGAASGSVTAVDPVTVCCR